MSLADLETDAPLACFKAYDIRGRVGRDLTGDIAQRIGGAVASVLSPRLAVVGRDCRVSGPHLSAALADGLAAAGVAVIDIGLAGTEEVYFATDHFGADVGIAVTASHNPAEDNGMKIVGAGCRPLAPDDFARIAELAGREPGRSRVIARRGRIRSDDLCDLYARRIAGQCDPGHLPKLRLVTNAGHGVAGRAFDAILARLPHLEVHRLNHAPDGRFPKGVPNPLLPGRRAETAEAVRATGADLGIAWDGDFDRCFLFDHTGAFVEGAHLCALLADEAQAAEIVLHDARVVWPMARAAQRAGARAVRARTGHIHMKRAMRETSAVYGGEMSGHHYFKAFMSCDSGMLPWLKVLARLGRERASLADLVGSIAADHPVSGEINYVAPSPDAAMTAVERCFGEAAAIDRFDGLSLSSETWRINLRASSTEPLIRLNVETRGDGSLLERLTEDVDRVLRSDAGCVRKT